MTKTAAKIRRSTVIWQWVWYLPTDLAELDLALEIYRSFTHVEGRCVL